MSIRISQQRVFVIKYKSHRPSDNGQLALEMSAIRRVRGTKCRRTLLSQCPWARQTARMRTPSSFTKLEFVFANRFSKVSPSGTLAKTIEQSSSLSCHLPVSLVLRSTVTPDTIACKSVEKARRAHIEHSAQARNGQRETKSEWQAKINE